MREIGRRRFLKGLMGAVAAMPLVPKLSEELFAQVPKPEPVEPAKVAEAVKEPLHDMACITLGASMCIITAFGTYDASPLIRR